MSFPILWAVTLPAAIAGARLSSAVDPMPLTAAAAIAGEIHPTAGLANASERKGEEGTLTVEGKTAAGEAFSVTVTCPRFVPPEDNG